MIILISLLTFEKMTHYRFDDHFNSIINLLNHREIHLNGGLYTWSNKRTHPTLKKLDRVLMSCEWEDLFSPVTVPKHFRGISNHNPLLLASNISKPLYPKKRKFCFELS